MAGPGDGGTRAGNTVIDAPELSGEKAPDAPKRGLKDRLWGGSQEKAPKPPREQRPSTPRPKRVDSSGMLGDFWGWMGRKVEEHYSLPTGRALQVEAEAAGIILSDLARDTLADRPIQWAARQYDAGSIALDLFGLPLMIERGARHPDEIPSLAPKIERALLNLGPSMAKAVKKTQKRREDFAASMESMRDVLGVPDGTPVTIEHMLAWFYPVDGGQIIPAGSRVA